MTFLHDSPTFHELAENARMLPLSRLISLARCLSRFHAEASSRRNGRQISELRHVLLLRRFFKRD